MIFEALQSELFRFKINSLSSKIPEFNLRIQKGCSLCDLMWPCNDSGKQILMIWTQNREFKLVICRNNVAIDWPQSVGIQSVCRQKIISPAIFILHNELFGVDKLFTIQVILGHHQVTVIRVQFRVVFSWFSNLSAVECSRLLCPGNSHVGDLQLVTILECWRQN